MLADVLAIPETPLTEPWMLLTLSLMPESVDEIAPWALVMAAVIVLVEVDMSLAIEFLALVMAAVIVLVEVDTEVDMSLAIEVWAFVMAAVMVLVEEVICADRPETAVLMWLRVAVKLVSMSAIASPAVVTVKNAWMDGA